MAMLSITALTLLVGNATDFMANNWDSSPQLFHNTDLARIERITSLLTPDELYQSLEDNTEVCNTIEMVREDRTVGGGPDHPGKFVVEGDSSSSPTSGGPDHPGKFVVEGDSSSSPTSSAICDFKQFDEALLAQSKATILLPQAHKHFDELNNLACGVQSELGHVTGINVYLSPPNSHGFLLHKDGHDLIIVQTFGRKIWTICIPINIFQRFSVEGKHYGEGWVPSEKEYNCYNNVLTPGDVLYLPRGTLHRPSTTETEGSMHLSIGIDVRGFRWVDVIVAHLREPILLNKLSVEALGEIEKDGTEDALATKPPIAMLQSAFDHPVSGDWEWHTLFGAMAGMIPSISDDLGMLTRSAFPMHLLEGERIFEPVYDIHAKGKYMQMIDLMSQACPEMMESVVNQFHLTLGESTGSVTATNEAAFVAEKCASVLKEAFPPSSFRFLAQNMMFGAQRLYERKCVLKNLNFHFDPSRKGEL